MSDELQPLWVPGRVDRVDALDALVERGGGGDVVAVGALRALVMDYRAFDGEIYSRALNRWWVFGDPMLEPALLVALADEEYGCRAWAATACGHLRSAAAVPLLIDLLRDPSGPNRASMCRAGSASISRQPSTHGALHWTGSSPRRRSDNLESVGHP